ncbi:MAG TPA: hypothetical protein DD400_05610, partial [Rhodospirillaceae bacterium]|nr:hypothetical protein [Rhodospirillaceae bacterium]
SDHSQTALAHVTTAGDGFADQAGKLVEHARQAEDQARTAMNVTNSLQEQAKQLRDALHDETDSASEMLSSLMGRLTSSSGDMSDLSATANMALTDLQTGIAQQTNTLNETMDQIGARQEMLSGALETQRETLSGLITRLSEAQDETASTAENTAVRLAGGTEKITGQMEQIDRQAKSSFATIQEVSESFNKEYTNLSQSAENAKKQTHQLLESTIVMGKQATESCDKLCSQATMTEQTIDTAVEKLEGKTTHLRDISDGAEKSLDNLSSSIKQQASAIDESLEHVSEKQTILSSSLDIQRETLSGMITRLTLAQDETAATAERSAVRLSDSADQISRKMETLDEQTQNALAAVRSAGNGLADEASAIGDHTEKAEKQIRNMLETTSGLHTETSQLRENMQTESTKVIEQIRTVMTQLETTVSQLKHEGGQVQNAIDKSALDLSTVSKNAGDVLQKRAEQLSTITEKAGTDITDVSNKIEENTKLIENASSLSKEHGLQLSETAERATTRLVELISKMGESDQATQEIFKFAESRLTETRTTLETELQNIAQLSQKAVEQVMGAGSTLAIQSDALRANLASSEAALTTAAETVREETIQLPNLLSRSTKEIDLASNNFKTQTTEIAATMLKSTDRCIGATGAIRDTMMDEARQLSSTADTAAETLGKFTQALQTQITSIKSGTGELAGEQKEMIENASETITQLSAASDRLSKLRGDTLQTTAKLAHEFKNIEARASETTKRLSSAGDNLSQQVAQLISMTEKAEGKMGAASKSFREQLETVRIGVQSQIDDINRGLMQITAQLDRTGTSLRSALAGTVVDVEKISSRFDQTSKDTANQLTDRTARMRVATEEVAKLLSGFGNQIDVLLDRLDMAGNGIKTHESDLVGHLQQAFSHLGSVAERLESTRVLTSNVSEAAITQLSDVSQGIDKQMRSMAEGGQKVATIIQSVAQTYVDQTQKVNGSVLESQEQIASMGRSVEEMQQRTDRMRVTLKLQGDDLIDSLEQVMGKFGHAGDTMSDAALGKLKKIGT